MALNYLKRIAVDIIELEKDPLENIFIHYDDDDITNIYALIIGLKDTPNEHGCYYFLLKFPTNYPSSHPTCKFHTINNNHFYLIDLKLVRFFFYICLAIKHHYFYLDRTL